MVDVSTPVNAARSVAPAADRSADASRPIVHARLDEAALAAYRAASRDAVFAPAQSPAWLSAWNSAFAPDGIVVLNDRGGRPTFALALEIIRRGPFRIARLVGGKHANGNFAPLSPKSNAPDMRAVVAAIRRARPDIDLLQLDRLAPEQEGLRNPLLDLPHAPSANISLACDLAGGFTELLARSSGKRKRKKYRSQSRKFDAAGGFRRIEARTPADVERLLDAFLAMKASRFRQAGIPNVFEGEAMRGFLVALFSDALAREPRTFVLHGLEVGGTLRAVTGSSRAGKRLICEFGAIVEDELSNASPGDFLFFENIREAAEQGLDIYDFSVGDELYKRLWCDVETVHFDVVMPVTLKGRALAAIVRAGNRGKSIIKNNPTVWRLAKRLRRRAAGRSAPPEPTATDED